MINKCIYLVLIVLLGACEARKPAIEHSSIVSSSYKEPYRPQYHFSPKANWMNDPNGLVFYEGEYHLFFQYYPDSTIWGPMHWGHAVSTDLVSWKELPIALYPDSLGLIFSGSAVIDHQNTSGFGSNGNPPMVSIFTHHLMEGEKSGAIDFQYQSLAFSLDKGRSWEKYAGNPVLANPGIKDFRDPKVSWFEEWQKWIMILAVKDRVHFYSSPDLKSWEFESEFGANIGAHGGVWECPDLFQLTDQNGVSKWVMLLSINPGGPQNGSATQYFLGEFDGKAFTSDDEEIRWVDYGADDYAGVTYNNISKEDGRRLFIGWMSNWPYARLVPTDPWRSAMTVPRELTLQDINGAHLLVSTPISELETLRENESQITNDEIALETNTLEVVVELDTNTNQQFSFVNAQGERLAIGFDEKEFFIDRTSAGKASFHKEFAVKHVAPLNGVIPSQIRVYLDASSVEVFVNDGQLVMTDLIFPSSPYTSLKFEKPIKDGRVFPLKSIWE